VLEAEQEMNNSNKSSALIDGLLCRQHACDILNTCLELGIDCDIRATESDSVGQENIKEDIKEEEVRNNDEVSEL
jgi:hypothetical protein